MMEIASREWLKKEVSSRNTENKEKITARANITKSKKISIRISIGLIICDLLFLKRADRVDIFLNKKDRNILLIKKSIENDSGYKLNYSHGSSYLTFDFICNFKSEFKIKQTIELPYDFNNKNILLDISKLKWEK